MWLRRLETMYGTGTVSDTARKTATDYSVWAPFANWRTSSARPC